MKCGLIPYKLRANISRFDRGTPKQMLIVEKARPKQFITNQTWRKNNISFAEALVGKQLAKKNQNKQQDPKSACFCFSSNKEDRNLMKKCFTGNLKEEWPWNVIGKQLKDLGRDKIRISYTGGDFVLFQSQDQNTLYIQDLDCFKEWFEFIRQWDENDVNNRRIVWTKWYGMPLHMEFRFLQSYCVKIWKIDFCRFRLVQSRKLAACEGSHPHVMPKDFQEAFSGRH